MFGRLIIVIAASLFTTASSYRLFAECPDSYTDFCNHGRCRFLVSQWEASCICFKGYIGNRCQYVDLLQVMAGDPRSFVVVALTVTLVVGLTLMGSACLGIYLCRIKRARDRLTLLNNIDINDV